MKIAYAGFDLMYGAMEALSENNEIIKLFTCAVDGVYEKNDRAVGLAKKLGIPYTEKRITREDIEELLNEGCELLISAGYYYLIPVDERLRMVNIHPSLLPYGRGAWPMPLAILDRLSESGVTVHKTERSFDTGDILMQERFELLDDETLESFMDKVNGLFSDMMMRLTANFGDLWNNARPQGDGEYQNEPDPEEYTLSAENDVEYADRVLRAFYGFPCYYRSESGVVEILKKRAVKGESEGMAFPLRDGYIC